MATTNEEARGVCKTRAGQTATTVVKHDTPLGRQAPAESPPRGAASEAL